MHHFAGWLITPDEIERRREREFKSSRSHQNGTIDPVGMGDHEGERHAAAEGIYDHRDLVDFQVVEKTDQLIGPDGLVGDTTHQCRSAERSVGKEWVRTCRSRWPRNHKK